MEVKLLSSFASVPNRATADSAGFDLKSARHIILPKRTRAIVETDLQIKLPEGTYARIAPRSGLARDYGIDVGAGVIDQDYRGSIQILLFNHSDEDYGIKVGDRVAQLIVTKIEHPVILVVNEMQTTIRDYKGFGSTGLN